MATTSHPVPIDLEMILQAADTRIQPDHTDDGGQAFMSAMQTVIDSVITIGLLPAYGRHSTSKIFVIGGVNSNSSPRTTLSWSDVNTDTMRPVKVAETATTISNLPYVDDRRGSLGDHLDDLMSGFADYAKFLQQQHPRDLLDDFAGLVIRTIIRPTRFYASLLGRLRDHRTMDDGVVWSAQADFAARLADWESDSDPMWPLQHSERMALVELNVPHFTTVSDGHVIRDAAGTSIRAGGTSGIGRAGARLRDLSDDEIAWQLDVIRQNTDVLRQHSTARDIGPVNTASGLEGPVFATEADALASTLSAHAVRSGQSAAWIGLDWLGDSEVSQLVVLGPDLYNGDCGIALFLAAHAAVTGDMSSRALALAALAGLRRQLRGRNPAHMARSLGLGGGLGLGSIVYSLAVIAALLHDDGVLADAHGAAELITDDVVAADRQLDVLGGSAGAILGLLRLFRQTGSEDALRLAENCGRWLLAQDRVGPPGGRTWASPVFGRPLNGISHGAAGYAYSLAALAFATGNQEFAESGNRMHRLRELDLRRRAPRVGRPAWHRRLGLAMQVVLWGPRHRIGADRNDETCRCAAGVVRYRHRSGPDRCRAGWPSTTDTLCCGTLGSIEFLWEAGDVLGRRDLRDRATGQLLTVVQTARATGDYGWSSGTSRFNLGLFRGVAGTGYTLLRARRPLAAQRVDVGVGDGARADERPFVHLAQRCHARKVRGAVVLSIVLGLTVSALPFVSNAAFGPVMQAVAHAGMGGNLAGVWDLDGSLLSRGDGATSGPFGWLATPLPFVVLLTIWAVALVAAQVLGFVKSWIDAQVEWKLLTVIRRRVHDHIQSLSLDFFTGTRIGALMQRVQLEAAGVQRLLTVCVIPPSVDAVVLVVALAYLIALSWQMTIVALVLSPFAFVALRFTGRSLQAATQRMMMAHRSMGGELEETVSGISEVQVFNAQQRRSERFHEASESAAKSIAMMLIWTNAGTTSAQVLIALSTVLVLIVGVAFSASFGLTFASLVVFVGFVPTMFAAVQRIVTAYSAYKSDLPERCLDV